MAAAVSSHRPHLYQLHIEYINLCCFVCHVVQLIPSLIVMNNHCTPIKSQITQICALVSSVLNFSVVCPGHVRGNLPLLQLVFSGPKGIPSHQDLLALGHPAHLHNCGFHWPSHHSCQQDTCSEGALHHLAWNHWNHGLCLSCIATLWRSAPPVPKCNEEIHSTASGHNEENTCIFWYFDVWFRHVCSVARNTLHMVLE